MKLYKVYYIVEKKEQSIEVEAIDNNEIRNMLDWKLPEDSQNVRVFLIGEMISFNK